MQNPGPSSAPEASSPALRCTALRMGYQFFNLIPTLTAAENIRLPPELNGAGCAAILAGVVPAIRTARVPPAQALRSQ